MRCSNCNNNISSDDNFCIYCGAKVESMQEEVIVPVKKQPKSKSVVLIILVAVIGILIGVLVSVGIQKINNGSGSFDKDDDVGISDVEEDGNDDPYERTTEDITTTHTTIDADKLYRPSADKFCNQYVRYVSGNFEGQSYAKMRFGPSKVDYNVVGQIDNGNIVTVQTTSVNGWTLVYYQGIEGWVRTDFLFATYGECFGSDVSPDNTYNGISAFVDVTGEYDGQNLNMRSGPSKDFTLITKVPDGANVNIYGTSNKTNEWVYISYKGNFGWVLSEYVFEY